MTTQTTKIKLNFITLNGLITDFNNPIVDPNTIIVPNIEGAQAFEVVKVLLDNRKFSFVQVGEAYIIVNDLGSQLGFYSAVDNTLTIRGRYSSAFHDRFEGETQVTLNGIPVIQAVKSTNTNSNTTVNASNISEPLPTKVVSNSFVATGPNLNIGKSAPQQVPQQAFSAEEAELEAHYNGNYEKYNTSVTEVDLDAERSVYAGTFQVQQPSPQTKRVLTVDGGCSGNPGTFDWRMVWEDNKEVHLQKHYGQLIGTNNIAEVLGLCTAVHHVISNNLFDKVLIKYDSNTAKSWIDKGAAKITSTNVSPEVVQIVEKALAYINTNRNLVNRIEFVKHDTKSLGQIAADFGRKGK